MIELSDVKNYLGVTYDDEDVGKKITRIFKNADTHCRKVIAAASDAELDPDEEQLVLDCCRYMFNDAFEDFDSNFMATINGMRAARQVAAKGDTNEDT